MTTRTEAPRTPVSRFPQFRRSAACLAALALATLAAGCGSDGDSAAQTPVATTPPPTVQKKPNIIFIMADDLGYSDLGAFGSQIRTPNLDALVKQGRILANHHTAAVCAVTRSMIMPSTM